MASAARLSSSHRSPCTCTATGTEPAPRHDIATPYVVVVTWAPGGNLPPLLAAAGLMEARWPRRTGARVSGHQAFVERAGFGVLGYSGSPEPDARIAFERRADAMMATAAGLDIASEVRQVLADARADLAIVDCMLPAALAAARATSTAAASLVPS